MKQSVGVVQRHTEVVKLSAIVSLECSIFAAWSITEDISPNCLTILHRVVHSQRFMAGLWNVLGLLHLQHGRDEIEKTHQKTPNQTNRRRIYGRRDHVRPAAARAAGRPEGQRSMAGERRTSAAEWGEVVRGPGSGSGESYAAAPQTHLPS